MVHGVPNRVDRVAALGRVVVPQVAEWIGRRIVAAEDGLLDGIGYFAADDKTDSTVNVL